MKKHILAPLAAIALSAAAGVQAQDTQAQKALIILSSGSLQTQGMAMVLGNTLQAQGVEVDVLLCDEAGDLALSATENAALKPRDVTPEQLLAKLQQGGAEVNVCALYLPNSAYRKTDLRPGVGVATPPQIAQQMMAPDTRVFDF